MEYRVLGRTGLRVSRVGIGGAVLGLANYLEAWDPTTPANRQLVGVMLHHALDQGINYLDTAEGYGAGLAETIMGEVVGARRDECVVATKVSGRDPATIRQSCEASLRRLQTDVIDVYQFHGRYYDPGDVTAILDGGGLETLQALRDEGKVRHLGFTAEAPTAGVACLIATGAFDVMQIRYNLLYQHACDLVDERGVVQEARAQGMGVVTMRSLTSGLFPRLLAQAWPQLPPTCDVHRLLLGYVLSNPDLDVALVGMRRPEEVDHNVAICDDPSARFDLTELHRRFV